MTEITPPHRGPAGPGPGRDAPADEARSSGEPSGEDRPRPAEAVRSPGRTPSSDESRPRAQARESDEAGPSGRARPPSDRPRSDEPRPSGEERGDGESRADGEDRADGEAAILAEFGGAMRLALDEARRAGEAGDVPVGAVVLDASGAVIGAGHNDRERSADPTGHAEVVALRAAAAARGTWRLDGCTLVVTLEPCTMCAGAAVQARVDRVVYGAVDRKAGAVGSLWDVVRDRRLNHRPEVIAEVMAEECGALLVEFFTRRRVG